MSTVLQDLRFGLRMLAKNPGFTAVAVLTLALGIGANTAIFSVVNAVLLRPLPYRDPGQLYTLDEIDPQDEPNGVSPADAAAFVQRVPGIENIGVRHWQSVTLTGPEGPENVYGGLMSSTCFSMLGTQPARGRLFLPEEFRPGAPGTIILSDHLWRRRFGRDPTVLGRPLMINGQAHTIIGVMPDGFFFDRHFELWTPWQMPADVATKRDMRFQGVARLKPGMTPQAVQVEADAVLRSIAPEDARKGWHVRLVSLHSSLTGSSRSALLVLFGAVGFVLLIACVNVANLLLARSLDRSKEIAVRAALGASRLRLVRAQLTESLLLGGLGGVAGLLLAGWGIRTLLMLFPRNIGVPRLDTVHIDTTVLLFTLGLSLVTGIAFGLIPALQAANTNLNKALKEGARSFGSGLRPHRLRNSLVVLETALSLVLLIGAGLMLRSFERLLRVNPGFNPEGVLTLRVPLPPAITKKPDQVAYYTRILERLQSLPGVNSVGLTTPLPLAGVSSNISFYVAGRPVPQGEMETVKLRVVSPGFFRAMSLALVRGRVFDASDGAGSPEVAVINETLARRYFPNQDPIGRRVSASDNPDTKGYTVVGVIHDVKELDLSGQPEPEMYRDFRQFFFAPFATTFALRTSVRDPMALAATVQKEIRVLNPDQPISDLMTMREVVSANIAQPRFYTLLLGLFAATALVLAVAGLYGVLSYSVNQRLHEIGVRMALGACRSDVLRMIVRQGLFLTLVGLVLGIIGAFALTRFLTSVLYATQPTDPPTFIVVSLTLVAVALLASYIPARRATKVDPMVALRYE